MHRQQGKGTKITRNQANTKTSKKTNKATITNLKEMEIDLKTIMGNGPLSSSPVVSHPDFSLKCSRRQRKKKNNNTDN